jgi:beta-glucosidase-like glycosyl hydrolase
MMDRAELRYIAPTFTQNREGPTIGTTVKPVIEVDGKFFRDSNGNGMLEPYEDWRLDSKTRAEDLVSRMSIDEKVGMMVINNRGMGIEVKNKAETAMDGLLDETTSTADQNPLSATDKYGTIDTIQKLHLRHLILRANPSPADHAQWINAMNQVAEMTPNGIPVIVASNSRNENASFGATTDIAFNKDSSNTVFSCYPGTLGLAAAAMGDIKAGGDAGLISEFAEKARGEWDAVGMKKAYMYMADVATDPRWQRTYGTLGERPDFIADAIRRLLKGFQCSSEGVTREGIGLTVKHFPGGGARENGFDPHYVQGQWNVYATENSLEKYQLAPFMAAVEHNPSSIMPYYAKPYSSKSAPQTYKGVPLDLSEEVGFAYNKAFVTDLLRGQMGFKGYINSDSGVLTKMSWGMEAHDVPSRAAYAVHAGADMFSDTNDVWSLKEAWRRGQEDADKYDAKYVLSDEDVNQSNVRLLKEMFDTGLFENPYRDPDDATKFIEGTRADEFPYQVHLKSVVLLKNEDNTLPLTPEKATGKKIYAQYFNKSGDTAKTNDSLYAALEARGFTITRDYSEADLAFLYVNPTSGSYFDATLGYLELDIAHAKIVVETRPDGAPARTKHVETTLTGAALIKEIADTVHANGGKVISNVNFKLAWMLGNVEPYSDALLAGFETFADATLDVIEGKYHPSGVLPLTLPKDDSVIKVDANGDCISPNDVPGYAKDEYMPDSMKDENGKAYAYRDAAGNYYESEFGLSY